MSLSKKLKLNVETMNREEYDQMNESSTFSNFFTHAQASSLTNTEAAVYLPEHHLPSHINSTNPSQLQTNKPTLSCFENHALTFNLYSVQDVSNRESQFEDHSENLNDAIFQEIGSTNLVQSHSKNNLNSYTNTQVMSSHEVPLEYNNIVQSTLSQFKTYINNHNAVSQGRKYNPGVESISNICTLSKIQNVERIEPTRFINYCINHNVSKNSEMCYTLPTKFLNLIDELNYKLESFQLPSQVKCVYNATVYARHTFEMYVRKYCSQRKPIMLFGMNPGPWGMSQTGVPFGEVNAVRDWLKIEGSVKKPLYELPMRPILGFNCKRSEMSGKRFWGLWKEICIVPENFFRTSFVYNYLPQQWMTKSGCNKTPSDFKADEMNGLYDICDPIFCKVLELYQVTTIVAIGRFCETRAKRAIKRYISNPEIYKVIFVPHPSPRTANSNKWNKKMIGYLEDSDLLKYYKPTPHEIPAVT